MIIPNLAYDDAPAAIEWLCKTFGFEKKMVVPGGDPNTVSHAQLTMGENGMIMISSVRTKGEGIILKSPQSLDGMNTQGNYVVMSNIDKHYANAKACGATITKELVSQEYGGKDYSCLDCEGNIWSFGTYDPWK